MHPCAACPASPPQIMWEAAKLPGGKQEWADIALQHMRTVTKELFRCRPAAAAYWNGTCAACLLTCLWGWWLGSRTSKPLRHGVARWFQPRSLPPTMPSPSREDGSTIHVVQFDPDTGAVVLKRTHQGYSDDSTWSR